MILFPYTFF